MLKRGHLEEARQLKVPIRIRLITEELGSQMGSRIFLPTPYFFFFTDFSNLFFFIEFLIGEYSFVHSYKKIRKRSHVHYTQFLQMVTTCKDVV